MEQRKLKLLSTATLSVSIYGAREQFQFTLLHKVNHPLRYIVFQNILFKIISGFFTTFVVLTQDGWVKKFEAGFDYYYEDPDANETVCLLWILLFVLMVLIFGFVIGSIFVTQVVTNLDKAMLEQNEDDRKEEDKDDILAGVFEDSGPE